MFTHLLCNRHARSLSLAALLSSTALLSALMPLQAHAEALAEALAEAVADDTTVVVVRGERAGYGPKSSLSATRTKTALINVPQAITVIGEKQIKDQSIQSMSDAVRYVPGFGVTQGEGNRDGLVFRGQSTTADLFIDGMRDDVQYYRDTYNIERIEALKGPNAMIFGRGSPGGLLNRVTKVADFTQNKEVALQFGSFGKQRVTADIGHSFSDKVSTRLTAVFEDSQGFRNHATLSRQGINPTLAFKPSEATLMTLSYESYRDERTADRGIPSQSVATDGTRLPLKTDQATFFGNPDLSFSRAEIHALQAFVEHRFDNGLIVRHRTRVADYDKFYSNVYPDAVNVAGTQVGILAYNNLTKRKNAFSSTDLIFSLKSGQVSHTFMTGFELGRQENFNQRLTGSFSLPHGNCLASSTTSRCDVLLSAPTITTPVGFNTLTVQNDGINSFAAVYVQDQIVFNEQWQAVIGLRYDKFDTKLTNLRETTPTKRDMSATNELISPRHGLIFKPVANASLYASYGITYVPRSGDQLAGLTPANQSLDPEEYKNSEIGAKWDISPNLSASLAVFQLNSQNAAVTDPNDPTKMILLSGDAQRVEGVELSLNGQIMPHWNIVAALSTLDAKTVQKVGSVPAGRSLAQTPKTSISLWNRYDFNAKWGAALGVSYRDTSFASISNAVTLPSYSRVDGALYYTVSDKVKLQLNVENLLDETYYPSAHSDTNITPGAPLTALVSLSLKY